MILVDCLQAHPAASNLKAITLLEVFVTKHHFTPSVNGSGHHIECESALS